MDTTGRDICTVLEINTTQVYTCKTCFDVSVFMYFSKLKGKIWMAVHAKSKQRVERIISSYMHMYMYMHVHPYACFLSNSHIHMQVLLYFLLHIHIKSKHTGIIPNNPYIYIYISCVGQMINRIFHVGYMTNSLHSCWSHDKFIPVVLIR